MENQPKIINKEIIRNYLFKIKKLVKAPIEKYSKTIAK